MHPAMKTISFQSDQNGNNSSVTESGSSSDDATGAAGNRKRAKPSSSTNSKSTRKKELSVDTQKMAPSPYFYYVDHSEEVDDDLLTPLTPPYRIVNFLIKLFCILNRDDLRHIIKWLPHGRSWRIIDPVEFELTVIPSYFGHSSMSSFLRQVNGWGFKRMTKGRNKNSYYNEYFLRGLPHLCKKAPRPGNVIMPSNSKYEPDLFLISEEHPIPEQIDRNDTRRASIEMIEQCIQENGPKGRIPLSQNEGAPSSPIVPRHCESGYDDISSSRKRAKLSTEACNSPSLNSLSSSSSNFMSSGEISFARRESERSSDTTFTLSEQPQGRMSMASQLSSSFDCRSKQSLPMSQEPEVSSLSQQEQLMLLQMLKDHNERQERERLERERLAMQRQQQSLVEAILQSATVGNNTNSNFSATSSPFTLCQQYINRGNNIMPQQNNNNTSNPTNGMSVQDMIRKAVLAGAMMGYNMMSQKN